MTQNRGQGGWPQGPEEPSAQPQDPDAPPPGYAPLGYAPPGYAPPGYAPAPTRPGHVTAASIALIVLGVFITLGGLLAVLGGTLIGSLGEDPAFADQLGNLPASIGGFVALLGGMLAAYGVLQIAAGISAMLGKGWARITGMIVAVIGALFSLAAVFPGEQGTAASVIVAVIVLGAYVYVVWAYTTNGRWFAPR